MNDLDNLSNEALQAIADAPLWSRKVTIRQRLDATFELARRKLTAEREAARLHYLSERKTEEMPVVRHDVYDD